MTLRYVNTTVLSWFAELTMDWETYHLTASLLFFLLGTLLIAMQATRVDPVWGFVVFLLPFAAPVFVMLHWRATKVPFLFWLAGVASILASTYGLAAHIGALLIPVGAAVGLMVLEYEETGTLLYDAKSDTELDMDSQERAQDSITPDD